ncbi:hypothetical protein [Microvirga splendida]|uniref:Uncharacterized protein n=1 Tax=Microvirga splendida TaxID=2795727 RepID=A0ABS0Y8C5_9HYPH|nr:hypothetical protein [Microvirga splendida]MBJ6128562.1 hypothetical protein [Microvirga splendida]
MVQDEASGAAQSPLTPLETRHISFVAKSLTLVRSFRNYRGSIEPSLTIEGIAKGASFAALRNTDSHRTHVDLSLSISTIHKHWVIEDEKLLNGLINVKYVAEDDDISAYIPETFDIQVSLPSELFENLYEAVRNGRLENLWFTGSPKGIWILKDEEYREPQDRTLFRSSESPNSENPFDQPWPLTGIGWREAETVLIPEPAKADPDAEAAMDKREHEQEEARLQVGVIQAQAVNISSQLSQLETILRRVSLLGTLILIALAYIAYVSS